ncbi:alcohol dehydrogenase catalytic domain-containing protein [Amycolatopsis carbonis]|uniref:alcohol dehydrogenase n=1 Tax=Amycolatopsis carbonis TaxID=715471 RepID=A0A9Y2I8W7_9PSEU|nr:alcohol dehydrogenase catalytic domain-containing protein [Amycolatopsis sp. 2-15]WIX74851.1 alcohol dehydrogenase catalytic domain-containing protein [Amycolatopsis sp. 2-15]
MRALRISAWGGALEPVVVAEPEPSRGEVLVRVEACGIGVTVLQCMNGQLGAEESHLPRVPGHELVGIVEAVGSDTDPALVGRRVMAYFYLVCGTCRECLASRDSTCLNFRGNVGVAIDGGYAEYAVLPSLNAIEVPREVDPVAATTIPDAIATPVHIARRAGLGPRTRVAVLAAGGGVGLHMVQVARAYGAEVVGLDVVPDKLEYLEAELGVRAVDSSDFGAIALPPPWAGKADVVIDLYGRAPAQRWALDHLAKNGSLMCLTSMRDEEFTVSSRELVLSQLAVLGCRYASRYEVGLAAELVTFGRVRPLVSAVVGPEEVRAVHERIRSGSFLGRAALAW